MIIRVGRWGLPLMGANVKETPAAKVATISSKAMQMGTRAMAWIPKPRGRVFHALPPICGPMRSHIAPDVELFQNDDYRNPLTASVLAFCHQHPTKTDHIRHSLQAAVGLRNDPLIQKLFYGNRALDNLLGEIDQFRSYGELQTHIEKRSGKLTGKLGFSEKVKLGWKVRSWISMQSFFKELSEYHAGLNGKTSAQSAAELGLAIFAPDKAPDDTRELVQEVIQNL